MMNYLDLAAVLVGVVMAVTLCTIVTTWIGELLAVKLSLYGEAYPCTILMESLDREWAIDLFLRSDREHDNQRIRERLEMLLPEQTTLTALMLWGEPDNVLATLEQIRLFYHKIAMILFVFRSEEEKNDYSNLLADCVGETLQYRVDNIQGMQTVNEVETLMKVVFLLE